MTSFLRHAIRSSGLTTTDKRAADSVLGRRHRLARAVSNQHTFALQSVVAALAAAAGALGLLVHAHRGTLFVVAAAVVAAAFALMWIVTRKIARERAHDLIAAGNDGIVLSVVARERRRLASRKERERLAKSLEAYYRDALRWYGILPQFRPPHGIQQLRTLGGEVAGLAAALRRERVRVQGVALMSRLLMDGYGSPLFANELGPLREELNRIRYLLETGDEVAREAQTKRVAA